MKVSMRSRAMLAVGLSTIAAGAVAVPSGATRGSGSNDRCGDAQCTMSQRIVLDAVAEEITLPTFRGVSPEGNVNYVVTGSSNPDDAERRGVNWAPKLRHLRGTRAAQKVTVAGDVITFPGGVEFNPAPTDPVRPGPDGIPSGVVSPGARGDATTAPMSICRAGSSSTPHTSANPAGFHDWTAATAPYGTSTSCAGPRPRFARGDRRRLRSSSDVIGGFQHGNLVSTGTGPPNASVGGIRANDAVSNCPVVADPPGVDPRERGAPGRR